MPIKLTAVTDKVRHDAIEIDGDKLNFTYSGYSPALLRSVRETMSEEGLDSKSEVVEILAATVKSWDLVDEAEAPVPVSKEILFRFDYEFLNVIFQKIVEGAVPKKKS